MLYTNLVSKIDSSDEAGQLLRDLESARNEPDVKSMFKASRFATRGWVQA